MTFSQLPIFIRQARPVFRYHGGKYRSAHWVVDHLPPHESYIEPFAGAASVLMAKSRSHCETLNDLDGEVVNVFRVIRDRGSARELMRLLHRTPFSREEFEAACEVDVELPPIERARRAIVRAFLAFGGSGVSGEYPTGFRQNSPRARRTSAQDWATYWRALSAFTRRLAGVEIEHTDAFNLFRIYDRPSTLFYCDPPYPPETRSVGSFERKHYPVTTCRRRSTGSCST